MVGGDSVLLGGVVVLQSAGKLDQREAEMKFTPGPWVYEKRLKDIKTVYGKLGMDTSELIPVILLGGGKNTDANGFLISAAPLLYAELKALIYLLEPLANAGGLTQSWIDALNRAKAALKKAEGE